MEEVNKSFDIGVLTVCDSNQIEESTTIESEIAQKTENCLKSLYNKLMLIKQGNDANRNVSLFILEFI